MLYPFLENTTEKIRYILLWVVYAILQAFVLYPIVALPLWMIILDGAVHASLFGLLGVLLWSVVRYGNYAVLSVYQRIVNYIALALLAISIWLSVGYGLFYWLFDAGVASQLIPILPIRGLIGLLLYLLIIQRFQFVFQQIESMSEIADPIQIQEEVAPQKISEVELLERIAVKSGSKIHVVLVPEILYLQADGDYVQIFTNQGKYLKEQTMKYFEEHLPENQFVRVHRSVIVNVEMISRIELYEKQNQLLSLKNGQQIKTSSAGYKALRAVLNL
ncbi:MAG TPA: LytTR family DNA-binding domain-containing protein [Paludibacter sp.]|nr:LytTR family DNA-binding domain-containing protein [Paludibacter sp.]